MAATIFEDAGCGTITAASADEALEALERVPALHVVFTDIRMPGKLDGVALAHHVATHWPDKKIIVLSGNELPLQRELPAGARFLAKPVHEPTLIALAAEICRG